MAKTNELITTITANNKQFLQSIGQSAKAAKEFSATATTSFEKVGKALATVFVANEAASFLKEGYESLERLNESAKRVGVSAESFQFLEYAAKQADVNIGDLESTFKRLNLSIARGDKVQTISDAFSQLGLSAKQLQALKPDEAFVKIFEAIKKLPRNQQIDIGTILGGKNFQQSLPLINEDLGKLAQRFRDLGGAVSLNGFEDLDGKVKDIDENEYEQSSESYGYSLKDA